MLLAGALLVGIGDYLGKTIAQRLRPGAHAVDAGVAGGVGAHAPAGGVAVRGHQRCSLVLVGALTDRAPTVLAMTVLVPALVPIVYSYVIYRGLEGSSKDDDATEE